MNKQKKKIKEGLTNLITSITFFKRLLQLVLDDIRKNTGKRGENVGNESTHTTVGTIYLANQPHV